MWVVGGTVAPFCLALPQLMLAFLAAGMSVTALAVGTALAGAVANLGLALAVCLLKRRRFFPAESRPTALNSGEVSVRLL